MQKVLEQLNTVPEVIGSLVCTDTGTLMAHIFPAIFDSSILQKACTSFAGGQLWAGPLTGSSGLLDLRYSDGRIIGRTLRGGVLFVLCTKAVNLQLLNISLNVAKNRIEDLLPAVPAPSAPATTPNVATPPVTPAQAAPPMPRGDDTLLTVDELDASSEAGRGFQELGMAAMTGTTAQRLCTRFQVSAVKKLRLTNQANGNSGSFGIMIINDDTGRYDGKIILSRQIEKKLQAGKGNVLQADLA
jgi:predicted regulator of Ras-like GTPase activity (Roadblock/LC7/MglB family)